MALTVLKVLLVRKVLRVTLGPLVRLDLRALLALATLLLS
jgi:hypothetical protein